MIKQFLYDWQGYNTTIFYYVNTLCANSPHDVLLMRISDTFMLTRMAFYIITAYTLLIAYTKLLCKSYYGTFKESLPRAAYSHYFLLLFKIGMSYTLIGLIYAALKFSFDMPRPFCSLQAGTFHTIYDVTQERCLSSFPSSHTALVVMLTCHLWGWHRNYIRRVVLVVLSLIVMISRMALAMHYPADILYSIIITLLIVYLSTKLYNKYFKNIAVTIMNHIYTQYVCVRMRSGDH